MIFDYNKEEVFTKSVDIIDIGNFALRCSSKELEEYIILCYTVLGKTAILKFGPILPDIPLICNNYSLTSKVINFKEAAIAKDVNIFINDVKKKINSIEEITQLEAIQSLPEISLETLLQ